MPRAGRPGGRHLCFSTSGGRCLTEAFGPDGTRSAGTPDLLIRLRRLRPGPDFSCPAPHSVRLALPFIRIGPVGRPVGEPPAGSSVTSKS